MATREFEETQIAELTYKVSSLNDEIRKLEKERDRLCDKNMYRKATDDLHALYECFIESGFDEDMARALTKETYVSGLKGGKH